MKKKKTIKNKSFYFDDYNESEILDSNVNFNRIKISLSRVTFLSFVFFSLLVICGIKVVYLSLFSERIFYTENIKKNLLEKRRNIVDRNGTVLATNVILYDVGIRPQLLKKKEKKTLLINLKLLRPDFNLRTIKQKLSDNEFFWLQKRVTPQEKDQLWLIGNKALEFKKKTSRIYPQKNLFSHVLGQTDDINEGISGVEKFFEKDLSNIKENKTPLRLTIDSLYWTFR